MTKKLEKFAEKHRKEFDHFEPSQELWSKIEKELKQKHSPKVISFPRIWGIAASIIITLGIISILFVNVYTGKKVDNDLAAITPAYKQVEVQYASFMDMKRNKFKSIEKEDPALYLEFWKESQLLDRAYNDLKQQAVSSPDPEIILQAMTNNLQLQIDLLNQQLTIVQQVKKLKSDEKSN